jgi:hypothetical protein
MPNSIVQGSARIRTCVKDGLAKARSKMAHPSCAPNAPGAHNGPGLGGNRGRQLS